MQTQAARSHDAERAIYRLLGTPGRVLFSKMQERADGNADYATALTAWVRGGGKTLALQDLVVPFGSLRDLGLFNAFADIDAASCKGAA